MTLAWSLETYDRFLMVGYSTAVIARKIMVDRDG